MQFGFNLPLSGPSASPAMLARLVAEGEAIGYDYAAISDHIVEPTDIHARYPYTESGEFPASSRGERHEQLTVIAYLAAKTSRLKFLTSVMVAPHRPAVLTAKMLATIDVMSGGRLIVGVGAGWLEEEFGAIGAPPFAERGEHHERHARCCWRSHDPEVMLLADRAAEFRGIRRSAEPTRAIVSVRPARQVRPW